MLKHIQAEHLVNLTQEKEMALCEGCKKFSANRINADEAFFKDLGEEKDGKEIQDRLLKHCTVDDLEGILITRDNRSTSRKSVIEFGWLVGQPDKTRTESYFHVKFDHGRGSGSGDESGANLGQNIFYRPASSGRYAVVLNMELNRIGYNDITREHVLSEEERVKRSQVLLESVMFTFLKPVGALRGTQNPHILGFEGVISISKSSVPAPSVSALNPHYEQEIEKTADQLNRVFEGHIDVKSFDSQSAFSEHIVETILELKQE